MTKIPDKFIHSTAFGSEAWLQQSIALKNPSDSRKCAWRRQLLMVFKGNNWPVFSNYLL